MKKIISICLLFLTFCQTNGSLAHAVLTDYSLKITPILVNSPANIELLFNSQIELGLSQFFLVAKGDKHQHLTAVAGSKKGQVIVHIPSLALGDYALKFTVFASDGHLTEDTVLFSVSK